MNRESRVEAAKRLAKVMGYPLYTVAEVAAYLGCSTSRLRKAARVGEIGHVRFMKQEIRFTPQQLQTFLRVKPAADLKARIAADAGQTRV